MTTNENTVFGYMLSQTALACGGESMPRNRSIMPEPYRPEGCAFDDAATRYALGQRALTGAHVPASYYSA